MNKENYVKVLSHIKAYPSCWDQSHWHCGTRHCFAGWAQLLAGKTANDDTVRLDARVYLDLTLVDADYLFSASRTITDFEHFNAGYNSAGYDRDGYNRDGYNRDGYDRDGYDRDGYDRDGYDRVGLDRDGYNRVGYDRDGYDRDGYDRDGLDRVGYDRAGLDRDGLDRNNRPKKG